MSAHASCALPTGVTRCAFSLYLPNQLLHNWSLINDQVSHRQVTDSDVTLIIERLNNWPADWTINKTE